jgi:branched-chain amino acid transport system ATP-binding protein
MTVQSNNGEHQGPILLDVAGVSVFYDAIQATWDVSFQVHEQRITGLLGSNGAGKTALMKAVSGLLPYRGGPMRFGETVIDTLAPHKRVQLGISLVPEGRKLFPRLSVEENLEIGAFNKRARKEIKQGIEWFYTMFPALLPRRRQTAGSLSGGEQQMLAIGRGLMSRPCLLMLDEPSLGLAPLMVTQVFKMVESINSEKISVLLVEQNVRHTLRLSHIAYVLENGHVTLQGVGEDLLRSEHVRDAYLGL